MSCKRCGACCRELTLRIDVGNDAPAEINGFKKYLSNHGCKVVGEGSLTIFAPLLCSHLTFKDGEGFFCKDYANRPPTCRTFLCERAKAENVPSTLGINVNDSVKSKEATGG
jgi:Fe-S-cluster containining protein